VTNADVVVASGLSGIDTIKELCDDSSVFYSIKQLGQGAIQVPLASDFVPELLNLNSTVSL